MSHTLCAIVVRDEDVKPTHAQYFVKSEKNGFSIIAPEVAIKHNIRMDMRRVQLTTDYFGGAGEQDAAYFDASSIITYFGDSTEGGAINGALALLGVEEEDGKDRFDVIGLGKYRRTDKLHPSFEPEADQEDTPRHMVGIPLEDYNETLRTLEDLSHWRKISLSPQANEETCKEMEILAQNALKLVRKGVLL